MSEAEWLACTDPEPMLNFLQGKASERKLRLFASACLGHIWKWLNDERSRAAAQTVEQYCDNLASRTDLEQAHDTAYEALVSILSDPNEQRWHYVSVFTADAVLLACQRGLHDEWVLGVAARTGHAVATAEGGNERNTQKRVRAVQAGYPRCIFSDRFHHVTATPSWLTSPEAR